MMTNQTDPGDMNVKSVEITDTIESSGYREIKQNKKLAEFCSPSGKTIYFIKTNATVNNINIMVHPSLSRELLSHLAGVDAVSSTHRFHSNMPQFPKKLHTGKTETTYGWKASIETLDNLVAFLNAFDAPLS